MEQVTGTMGQQVIPNADAKAYWERKDEDRGEPLHQPHKLVETLVLEVPIELWQLLLKQVIKLIEVLKK